MNVAVVIFVLPKPELFALVEFGGGLETFARNEDVIEKAHRNENAWEKELSRVNTAIDCKCERVQA